MTAPITFDLSKARPGRLSLPRIIGAAVEGGTSLSGVTQVTDITGGGFIAVDYSSMEPGNTNQSNLRYLARVANMLAGGVRQIIMPLMTDFIQPTSLTGTGATFSDASVFSDTSTFASANVSGAISGAYSAGAGTVSLTIIGGTATLEGGEWFGVIHPTKSFRAYQVIDVDSVTTDGSGNHLYTVGIRPVLRDSLSNGTNVDWWRPRCMMRLAPGTVPTIELEQFWRSTPSMSFIEAF